MTIRPMVIEDYDEVYGLWTSTPGVGIRSLDDSREGIERFLRRNPDMSFVAEEDGKLAGATLCGHDGRRGYLYHTTVKPDCRGKGTGKALVTAALDALKRERIHRVALVAFNTNEPGNAFWEALGFTVRSDLVYRNLNLSEENL